MTNKEPMMVIDKVSDSLYLKRGDKYELCGVNGGKVKACYDFLKSHTDIKGLVTACSIKSPQGNNVLALANMLNVPCHIHIAKSKHIGAELAHAQEFGALIFSHSPGWNPLLCKWAKDDAKEMGYLYIPFGMEDEIAVESNKFEVQNIPDNIKTVVVTMASAITLSGILRGRREYKRKFNIFAVCVGSNRKKIIERYVGPIDSISNFTIKQYDKPYNAEVESYISHNDNKIRLDPNYEAKTWDCFQQNKKDILGPVLFWIVGVRSHFGMVDVDESFYAGSGAKKSEAKDLKLDNENLW